MRSVTRVVAITLFGLAACIDSTDPSGGGGLLLLVPPSAAALDSGIVILSGATSKRVKVTPGRDTTIAGLTPGSYSVTLEGYAGGGVSNYTTITGVTVTTGQNTSVPVTSFPTFRPSILDAPTFTFDGRIVVVFSKIPAAASYIVQRDTLPAFTTARDTAIAASDTSPTVSVVLTKPSNVRVLAVAASGARGQPSVAVAVAAVTKVVVTPASATIASGATQTFSAVAQDAGGNPVTGVTFFWASSNQNVALVDQAGVATGFAGGAATITALGLGLPGSAALTVNGPVPTKIAYTVQPTNANAGAAISPAVELEVQDASGARVTTARNTVTLAIGTNPGSGTLSGSQTVNAVNGVATLSGLSIDKAGTGYTLAATSGTLTGATSAAFNIAPGPATAALLANGTYVDFNTTSTSSEASNLMFALQSFGSRVNLFVDISAAGITDATRNARIIAIPELEVADVTPALSSQASQTIVGFVQNGGTLISMYPSSGINLINTLFAFTIGTAAAAGPYTLDAAGATGTAFAGGPASITQNNATSTVTVATLPTGSKVIYRNAGDAAVVVVPVGSGQIIIFGVDFFNSKPFGTQDGGWVEVIRRGTL